MKIPGSVHVEPATPKLFCGFSGYKSVPPGWFKILVLQQTHHIVTHTGPHKVTSSNMYQIKAKSLPNQKMHDATSVCWGVNFYESLKKGTHTNK